MSLDLDDAAVGYEVNVVKAVIPWSLHSFRPFHVKATQDPLLARYQLGDRAIDTVGHEAPESGKNVGPVQAPSWMVGISPAHLLAEQRTESIEIVSRESPAELIGYCVIANLRPALIVSSQRV